MIIIPLEARLRPNIRFTLRPGSFGGVHAFGYKSAESEPIWINLEHAEYIVGAGPSRWARSAQYRQFESQAKF